MHVQSCHDEGVGFPTAWFTPAAPTKMFYFPKGMNSSLVVGLLRLATRLTPSIYLIPKAAKRLLIIRSAPSACVKVHWFETMFVRVYEAGKTSGENTVKSRLWGHSTA